MADEPHNATPLPGRGTPIAWLISCLVPLVFVAVMLLAPQPSDGAEAVPPQAGTVAEPEAEEESGEEGWESSEEGEYEEWDEEEAEAGAARPECPLRSVRAHAAAKRDKLKLTIGYTTNEPFNAGVEIKQGSTQIDSVQRHFGHSGVLRLSGKLNEQRKDSRLVVRIRPASGGSGCPSRRLVLFPH